jgi:V8-like Glu-specific endopeptidase
MGGQSGAPLVEQRAGPAGSKTQQYVVRAIISHEVCKAVCGATCCPNMTSYNGAVKITPQYKRFIDKYKNMKPYEASRRRA